MRRSYKDYVGERYGKWEVIGWKEEKRGEKRKDIKWICRCECGEEKEQKVDNIISGRSMMCKKCSGKSRRKEKEEKENKYRIDTTKGWTEENTFYGTYSELLEYYKERKIKEVLEWKTISHRRIYAIWSNMKDRCYNPKDNSYKHYGGRGIEMCLEWKEDPRTFIEWAYRNGYDDKKEKRECTIDRIDVNGNYEPSNCRWITNKEQNKNKRTNIRVKYMGKEWILKDLSKKYNKNYATMLSRIKRRYEYRGRNGIT